MMVAAVAALAYTGACLWLARGHANFRGDDFNAFRLANDLPMLKAVLTPSDVHFSPLQRLASYAIFKLAPMNFDVALAVLAAFHLLAVVYLYKALELIRSSVANVWLCFWYSTNVYLPSQFLWWSSGMHRLPYILFAIACVYNYLHYRRSRSRLRLTACFLCWAAAAGFFSKAVLLPALLLGIEICLLPTVTRRDFVHNGIVILVLFASSVAFTFLSLSLAGQSLGTLSWDPARSFSIVRVALIKLQLGWFGIRASAGSIATLDAVARWPALVFVLYSVVRAPRSSVAWLGMLVLTVANVVMAWLAPRPPFLRFAGVLAPRYYFESMFIVVLFGALVLDALVQPAGQHGESRPWRRNWMDHVTYRNQILPTLRRFAGVLAVFVLMGIATVSFRAARSQIVAGDPARREGARIVRNLVGDVSALHQRGVSEIRIANGRMPRSVLDYWIFNDLARYENFMPLVDPSIEVVDAAKAAYRVSKDGHLIPVAERRRAGGREAP